MRYMGGKFRQSKALCQVLKPYVNKDTIYVEPFCGGMWSAARVARELHPKEMVLNDINKPLMLLWEKCLEEGCDWLPVDAEQVEREYPKYRTTQDENDPLTAWYGIALSFGGKWFGGVARAKNWMLNTYTVLIMNTAESLRKRRLTPCGLLKLDYTQGLTRILKFRMMQ